MATLPVVNKEETLTTESCDFFLLSKHYPENEYVCNNNKVLRSCYYIHDQYIYVACVHADNSYTLNHSVYTSCLQATYVYY